MMSVHEDRGKPSKLGLYSIGCLLVLLGALIFPLPLFSTREFWGLNVPWIFIYGLPLAVVSLVVMSILFLIIIGLIAKVHLSPRVQHLFLLAPSIMIAAFWLGTASFYAMPRSRFRSEIADPVPNSVQDIKVAGFRAILGGRWVFTFRIDTAQVSDIVSKKSLVRTNYFGLGQDRYVTQQVAWARNIRYPSNALFYSRFFYSDTENSRWSHWINLVVDTNSSHAWCETGFAE